LKENDMYVQKYNARYLGRPIFKMIYLDFSTIVDGVLETPKCLANVCKTDKSNHLLTDETMVFQIMWC
jgi:hypothetical protein